MLSLSDTQQLAAQLPPLQFDIARDAANTQDPLVKKYLAHYKINFADTLSQVRHGFGNFQASGATIAAHYWLPEMPRGTVFILHGYFDHVGLFNHLIRFSLQNDYAVVAYDQPGMGLSSGERASIDSFERYYEVFTACLDHFAGVVPGPWHGIGQSTGTSVLVQHLQRVEKSPLKKVVLLAPLVRSSGWLRDRWRYHLFHWFVRSIPRRFTENSHDQEFLTFLRKHDPLQYRRLVLKWVGAMKKWIKQVKHFQPMASPVLIIQGDSDKTVDWHFNLELLKKLFPNAQIKIVPQARHHLVAESAPYRAQVFATIKTYLDKG